MSWQLIPVQFNGPSTLVDLLVFRPSDGAFAKWYGHQGGFDYQALEYIGGQPGRWTDARLIPVDFNGDGFVDILAFRPSDGAFAKWYSDGTIRPDFNYQPVQHIGGQPNVWQNAQLIPADFNRDGFIDILAFLPDAKTFHPVNGPEQSISYVAKWYSDKTTRPDFDYQKVLQIGVTGGGDTPDISLIPADLDGDGATDFLSFFPNKDEFAEWWEAFAGIAAPQDTFAFNTNVWQIGG